jgi:hypothetical protein
VRPIRTYAVTVDGFPEPHLYSARSPAKARVQCWRAYCAYDDRSTFGSFLKISRIRRAPDPPGIGDRILVCGIPATRVIGHGQYTHFMRDDSDTILLAHPSEVQPMPESAVEGAK